MKKVFKRTLLALMVSTLVLGSTMTVFAAETTYNAGERQDTSSHSEVVAKFNGTNQITISKNSEVSDEDVPNAGFMADSQIADLVSYLDTNHFKNVSVTIDSSVKNIGDNILSGCSAISSVTIQGNVDDIGTNAFSNCPNLKTVTVSGEVEAIADSAFSGCTSLQSVTMSTATKTIGANAFSGCTSLKTVNIPDTVTTIGDGAFSNCTDLAEITGGKGLKTIGVNAFTGSKSITLPAESSAEGSALFSYDWISSGYTAITEGSKKMFGVQFVTNCPTSADSQLVEENGAVKLPSLTYADHTLDGWYTDAAFTTAWAADAKITENITLYAKWHGDTVTVTFNPSTVSPQTVKYGEKIKKPADPTMGTQVFAGWFTESTYLNQFDFEKPVTADITLYAKWVDPTMYTVTFNTDGGSAIEDQSIASGAKVAKPADPTKQDFTFDAWYKEKDFKNKWDFDKDTISGDTTLYAQFKSNKVTVKFNTNGGSTLESVTVDRGGKVARPGDPTKENCDFVGWYKDEGLFSEWVFDSDSVNDNITLYAKWNQNAYTVKFESNGGSAVAAVTANPNTLIAKPADPTKDGYTLESWCKDSALTTAWNFDADQVTADITLYAKWVVGDPATQPGVSNTGASIPKTGDASIPGVLSMISMLGGTGALEFLKRRK